MNPCIDDRVTGAGGGGDVDDDGGGGDGDGCVFGRRG